MPVVYRKRRFVSKLHRVFLKINPTRYIVAARDTTNSRPYGVALLRGEQPITARLWVSGHCREVIRVPAEPQ